MKAQIKLSELLLGLDGWEKRDGEDRVEKNSAFACSMRKLHVRPSFVVNECARHSDAQSSVIQSERRFFAVV